MIELVNQERAKAGLSQVKYDELLTKVATEKARDMDVNNYFSHTSPTYGSPFDMMRSFGVQVFLCRREYCFRTTYSAGSHECLDEQPGSPCEYFKPELH